MSEHTPGPWAVDLSRQDKEMGYAVMSDGTEICATASDDAYVVVPMKLADARLIAAAPDLLEGAKAALGWIEYIGAEVKRRDTESLQPLRDAIAKAEGK